MLSSEPPRNHEKKTKLDPNLLAAASYRDLAHWIAILNLDTNALVATDDFKSWVERSGVELRELDEGGFVVRGGSGAFLFIDRETSQLCDLQLEEVKPYWLESSDKSTPDGGE
jgi:hypothetical protein